MKRDQPSVENLLKEQTRKTEEATGKMIVGATHDAKAGPAQDVAAIQEQLDAFGGNGGGTGSGTAAGASKTGSLIPPRPDFYKPHFPIIFLFLSRKWGTRVSASPVVARSSVPYTTKLTQVRKHAFFFFFLITFFLGHT